MSQVYAGILEKYVNLGSGWHRRFFVVQNGTLRYYLIGGKDGIDPTLALARLRGSASNAPSTSLTLIGAQTAAADKPVDPAVSGGYKFPPPRGEVPLRNAKVRASGNEERKFYLEAGGKITYKMRAESREERDQWVGAFQGAVQAASKVAAKAPAGVTKEASDDPEFDRTLGQVKDILWQQGVAEEVVQVIERLLQDDHDRICRKLRGGRSPPPKVTDAPSPHRASGLPPPSPSLAERSLSCLPMTPARREDDELVSQRSGGLEGDDSSDDDTPEIWFEAATDLQTGAAAPCLDASGPDSLAPPGPSPLEYLTHPTPPSLPTPVGEGKTAGFAKSLFSRGQQRGLYAFNLLTGRSTPSLDSDSEDSQDPSAFAPLDLPGLESRLDGAQGAPSSSAPQWLAKEKPVPRRAALPKPLEEDRPLSNLWSLIKEAVGRDLTRICLPVYFNEPLSALQKACEEFEYAELLDQAAALPPASLERLLKVAAFAVSSYASTEGRTCKPFNPLLGETFEFVCPEKGFRFLSEKVCHHPTILASHCEGRGWTVEGDAEVRSRFWGRSIELVPLGRLQVTFADGEVLSWSKVTTSINNLILGKIYIDHAGTLKVSSNKAPYVAHVRFLEQGVLHREGQRLTGAVYEAKPGTGERGGKVCLLRGKWTEGLSAVFPQVQGRTVLLWTKAPLPRDGTRYNLTRFAVQLNEITPGLAPRLAPTDCRLRPDQAALEKGEVDRANAEKQRLEKKQRAARKAAEEGKPIRPRWFTPLQGGGSATSASQLTFKYAGGYWESRDAGKFSDCRDIFTA